MMGPLDNEGLQQKQLELETLLEITNSLLEYESVRELLEEILYRICSILDASSGFILIEERSSDLFVPGAVFNMEEPLLASIIFHKKKGFLAELATSGSRNKIILPDPAILKKLGKEHALVAPLTDKQHVIGAIILLDKESRNGKIPFTENDRSMLSAISVQASVAYSNTSLLDNLLSSQRFSSSVLESIQTGVITTNLIGEVDLVNQSALDILSIAKETIQGNHYAIVFEQAPELLELIQVVETGNTTHRLNDFTLKIDQKEALVNLSISPLMDDQKETIGIVLAIEDISDLDKVRSTFRKYVSKQIVDQILQHEDQLNLGGQELTVTTLFSDIRGFTAMSEEMDPIDVVNTLNEYFDHMIDVLFRYNGTLDKIIGDALMVIYGAPIGNKDDMERAVRTAIEMQQALAKLNVAREERGQSPLHIGIGLNEGKVVAGNIGSKEQMNYTVIGDAVNLAARLCSYAKPGQIIVSGSIYEKLQQNAEFAFKRLEPIQVKGKSGLIDVYEVRYFHNIQVGSIDERHIQIEQFLLEHLPPHLHYHSIDHIRDVVDKCKLHGEREGLDVKQLGLLQTAAWLHDIGFIWDPPNHEERGCVFTREQLPNWGFSSDEIETICGLIMATKIPQSPKTIMEQVICDADLDYLGRDDFPHISALLYKEINEKSSLLLSDWFNIQDKFFKTHHYFTRSANALRAEKKQQNYQTFILPKLN